MLDLWSEIHESETLTAMIMPSSLRIRQEMNSVAVVVGVHNAVSISTDLNRGVALRQLRWIRILTVDSPSLQIVGARHKIS